MDIALQRQLLGASGRSQILTGLRGVGKTVLLNEFEDIGKGLGYQTAHLEISEDGVLTPLLVGALRRVLLDLEAKRRYGDAVRRALGVLKAFAFRFPDGTQVSIDVETVSGPADSGDLASDLAGLFLEIGEVVQRHGTGLLLTIDELHFVDTKSLKALIMGNHRAAQKSLPIAIAGAGLPTLAARVGQAGSYAERMFTFPHVGSLPDDAAAAALEVPAADFGVRWTPDALERVLAISQGYPYFLQEFGAAAWRAANGPDVITADDVEASIPSATAQLDDGFFRVRIGRTSSSERMYLRAMAELGADPVRTVDVATLLGRATSSLGPTRDTLIKKALCYAPKWGHIAFTVPLFDQYLKRLMPLEIG